MPRLGRFNSEKKTLYPLEEAGSVSVAGLNGFWRKENLLRRLGPSFGQSSRYRVSRPAPSRRVKAKHEGILNKLQNNVKLHPQKQIRSYILN